MPEHTDDHRHGPHACHHSHAAMAPPTAGSQPGTRNAFSIPAAW